MRSPDRYAQIEIERRFLLKAAPADLPDEYFQITDLYFPDTRLRLRKMLSHAGEFVTAKFTQKFQKPEQSSLERTITNIYLDPAEYDLLASLGGYLLTKKRYPYYMKEQRLSLDVFDNHLAGLVLCDLDNEKAASLPAPPFALREVTEDAFFDGGNLAQISAEEFAEQIGAYLEGFG